jgi:hypothetical protein
VLIHAGAATTACAQIPALLPDVASIPATQPMPLDGTWLITEIGKKIRFEAGRAFAVDPWMHMLIFKVSPGMVVIRDIKPIGPGRYSAYDLPLMGSMTMTVQPDRSLMLSVAGAVGPATYRLVAVQLDNAQWFAQEMRAAGLGGTQQVYQPPPPQYQPSPPPGTAPQAQYQPGSPMYQPVPPSGAAPQSQYQPGTQAYQAAPPSQAPPPVSSATCKTKVLDTRTGQVRCAD